MHHFWCVLVHLWCTLVHSEDDYRCTTAAIQPSPPSVSATASSTASGLSKYRSRPALAHFIQCTLLGPANFMTMLATVGLNERHADLCLIPLLITFHLADRRTQLRRHRPGLASSCSGFHAGLLYPFVPLSLPRPDSVIDDTEMAPYSVITWHLLKAPGDGTRQPASQPLSPVARQPSTSRHHQCPLRPPALSDRIPADRMLR